MFDASCELRKLGLAQRRRLPQVPPEIAAYRLALDYQPAYMATGDYHDFFKRPDGRTAIFVGDGAGHGPAASILTMAMQAILRTHPELHRDPGSTMAAAGRMFHAVTPADLFMTGVYLLLGENGKVSWASAGHDPPLRITGRGEVAAVDLAPVGLPLGICPQEDYPTVAWELSPGERLLLFTDGLVEARNTDGEPFGRSRLRSIASHMAHLPVQEMVRGLIDRAAAHMKGSDFEDDFTVVAVEAAAWTTNTNPFSNQTSELSLLKGDDHGHRCLDQLDHPNRTGAHPRSPLSPTGSSGAIGGGRRRQCLAPGTQDGTPASPSRG
jgi:phosphoserine phosphatase RsbU/P